MLILLWPLAEDWCTSGLFAFSEELSSTFLAGVARGIFVESLLDGLMDELPWIAAENGLDLLAGVGMAVLTALARTIVTADPGFYCEDG